MGWRGLKLLHEVHKFLSHNRPGDLYLSFLRTLPGAKHSPRNARREKMTQWRFIYIYKPPSFPPPSNASWSRVSWLGGHTSSSFILPHSRPLPPLCKWRRFTTLSHTEREECARARARADDISRGCAILYRERDVVPGAFPLAESAEDGRIWPVCTPVIARLNLHDYHRLNFGMLGEGNSLSRHYAKGQLIPAFSPFVPAVTYGSRECH